MADTAQEEPLADQLRQQFYWAPGEIREVRAFGGAGRGKTGLCDSPESCAALIGRVPPGMGIYVLLNPIRPDAAKTPLHSLQATARNGCVGDGDILHRSVFAMDFDPVRPKDVPATQGECEASLELAQKVVEHMSRCGWPTPTLMSSGNGIHAYWPCMLPARSELPRRVLDAISARFSTDSVKVDTVIYNAARIMRAVGTLNCKGKASEDRPHRITKLLSRGAVTAVLQESDFQKVLGDPNGANAPAPGLEFDSLDPFDLEGFLDKHGIVHAGKRAWKREGVDVEMWPLKACPFDPSHDRQEAAVFRMPDGTLGFKCHHTSCSAYHWKEFRRHVEGQGPVSNRVCMEPFPLEALPPEVRGYCEFLEDTMGVPPGAIAASFLAALLAAVGNGATIQVWPGWCEQPGLFAMLVAGSGRMKSAIQGLAVAPLYQLEAMPPGERVVTNDATTEGFAKLSQESPRGLCLHMDEVSLLVDGADRYRPKGRGDQQFWTLAYDGRPYRVDRKKAESLIVPRLSCSIIGSIQPEILSRQAQGAVVESGLIPRFMLSYWDTPRGPISPPTAAQAQRRHELDQQLLAAHQRLRMIPNSGGRSPVAACTQEAQQLVSDYANKAGAKLEQPIELAMCEKSRGWAARIAALFALMRAKAHSQPNVEISGEDMGRATQIVGWQLGENLRIVRKLRLGTRQLHGARSPSDIAEDLHGRAAGGGFTVRDFCRATGLRSTDAERALKELVDAGELNSRTMGAGAQGGHVTTRYYKVAGPQTPAA